MFDAMYPKPSTLPAPPPPPTPIFPRFDSDVVMFDDPYRYFKSPPFSNFTIINQPEILWSEDQYEQDFIDYANGGLFYIQNARPDGPAAWLVAEVWPYLTLPPHPTP